MALHQNSLPGDNHVIHNFEYADLAARLAAVLTAADVKKIAMQLDDYSLWMLTSHSPMTWQGVGSGGGSSVWGGISGTLSNQADLQSALNAKAATTDIRTAGVVVVPSYVDNGDGTITVGTGEYSLYHNKTFSGAPTTYTIAGGTFGLVNNSTNYLLANYNGGTPNLTMVQTVPAIDDLDSDSVPIFSMYRYSTDIHVFTWDHLALGLSEKLNRRFRRTDRFHIDNGLGLSESPTRVINIASGAIWVGANLIQLSALDSSNPESHFYYHVGGVSTRGNINQYNNTQYDNGTNLVTLANNKYAVNWVYRSAQVTGAMYVILGRGDYTLLEAQSSAEPPKPDEIATQAVLVGRIIVLKGASTATQIDRVIDTTFGFSGAISHNDLTGIQGGTLNDYIHLTTAEHDQIPLIAGKTSMTGFPVDSSGNYLTTLTYNEVTRTVTIAPTLASFEIYVGGVKYTKTAESIQHADVAGGHYIYYDTSGVLTYSTTPWNILSHCMVAYVFWDAINNRAICFEERHHSGRDLYWHRNQHAAEGTKTTGTGFGISGYVLNDGSTDAVVTFGVASGRVEDEDIRVDTVALADAGPYTIVSRTGATGEYIIERSSALPFIYTGTNLQYNNFTGGIWTRTNVPEDNFMNVYVFALTALPSADVTPPSANQYIIIPGQAVYTTEALAHAETVANLNFGTVPFQEIAPLYQITLRYNATNPSAFANTARTAISRVLRIIGTNASITAASVPDHGSLAGLNDNDHLQYDLGDAQITALGVIATSATIALVPQSKTYTATTAGNTTIAFTNTPSAGFDRDIQLRLNVSGTDTVTFTGALYDGGTPPSYSGGGKLDTIEIKFLGSTPDIRVSGKDVK